MQAKQREEEWRRKAENAEAAGSQRLAEENGRWAELKKRLEAQLDTLSGKLQQSQVEAAEQLKHSKRYTTSAEITIIAAALDVCSLIFCSNFFQGLQIHG